jgi:hypothetical protein
MGSLVQFLNKGVPVRESYKVVPTLYMDSSFIQSKTLLDSSSVHCGIFFKRKVFFDPLATS